MSLVQIWCCKYRDKFLNHIDRVSTCLAIGQASCDEGIVTRLVLRANGLVKYHEEYQVSPFARQMHVGRKCIICYNA